MKIYVVYVAQINSYGDLLDDDLPVSWHRTQAGADLVLAAHKATLINIWQDTLITDRKSEDTSEIISEHCYVEEHDLLD